MMINHPKKSIFLRSEPAPIILFVYNRIEELKKTINALQNNYFAGDSDLYVFSDGPKLCKPNDKERVEKVRDLLHSLSGFKSITLKEQAENIGLANSIISGITEVSSKYDRFIVLEDDLLTSPYFLKYMNESLEKFKDESKVWCINGMALNPECLEIPDNYPYDTYFNYRNSSHGWGSWSDRWQQAVWDHHHIRNELFPLKEQLRFNRGGNDMTPMMQAQFNGKIDSWAIRWSYSISRNDGVTLSPVHSFVSVLVSGEGTHVKSYSKVTDNDLSLALDSVTYPEKPVVDREIARRFALNYHKEVPVLLASNGKDYHFRRDFESSGAKHLRSIHLSSPIAGGAGLAVIRLHQGLTSHSEIYTLSYAGDSPDLSIRTATQEQSRYNSQLKSWFNEGIYKGNTVFSSSIASLERQELDAIIAHNDIINLHWVPGLLSTEAIAYLSHSGKPIVWTFHDKNPLTGGCHYFHGCEKWQQDCMNCPQLKDNYDNYPAKVLATKKKYFNSKNITVVVLNRHFKTLLEKSPLFCESRVEIIPNAINTEFYTPSEKTAAKKRLKLPLNKKILFYIANSGSSIKGYKEFCKSMSFLRNKDYHILLAGSLPEKRSLDFSYTDIGHVDEQAIIQAYNASDVTIVSSIEDNLPNIMLESLSCGTPVVGFKVGGIPDIIIEGYNGYTVKSGDCEALAESIIKVLEGNDMSANCRQYAEENLRLDIQASRYQALYEELLTVSPKETSKTSEIPEVFPETSHSLVKLFNKALGRQVDDRWYRFGQLSRKRKLWVIGKYISKKLRMYPFLLPVAKVAKNIYIGRGNKYK